uniref:Uncharacterized protein n=1 Tax=Trypanosoma vivax (strain Y486) TaxID=1055687 RepID=G0U5N5_TRYVY|nr:hypothetical protein TVY486_1002390 [Trypanosoma vivax Y486]
MPSHSYFPCQLVGRYVIIYNSTAYTHSLIHSPVFPLFRLDAPPSFLLRFPYQVFIHELYLALCAMRTGPKYFSLSLFLFVLFLQVPFDAHANLLLLFYVFLDPLYLPLFIPLYAKSLRGNNNFFFFYKKREREEKRREENWERRVGQMR